MKYEVVISDVADSDFADYLEVIINEYKSFDTATKHYDGIMKTIRELRKNPFVNAIRDNFSLNRYGYGVRRVNFQKMAIIYTVYENTIYIHRIIPGNMIIG